MKTLSLAASICLALLVTARISLGESAEQAIIQDELVRRSQELFDAVTTGNQDPWKKYYVDDCLFADEKGRQMDKAKLVADITPLPAAYSGTIKLVKPTSRIFSGFAV